MAHPQPIPKPTGKTDPLLQPFQLGHLTLKNRIMSTSHAIGYGVDAMPQEQYQLYHEEKAKGGIGLTMFGGSSNVSADSGSVFGQLSVATDEVIGHFRTFSDRIHRHGSALMCQITHLGGRSHWRSDKWLPTVSPSRYREPSHRGFTKAMERHDINRIIREFGDAAWRCREGGLDGLEIHVHGHLLGQFWSPAVNQRTDEFGGSLENRARFGLRVLEEIRRRTGDGFLVGLRMAVGEGDDGGMTDEDYLEMGRIHERSNLVDFFNLTYGRIDTEVGLAEYMPGMAVRLAPQLPFIAAFRKHVGLPTFHAARINDLATARHAVREGLVDLVGMTRAHIADPHIVNKLAAGAEERIRPCVGATYCSWQRRCIHNASIGREKQLPHLIARADILRRVTVVGAGPAGLEAARVAAERGHDVTVLEAAPQAGGQVLVAAQLAGRRDLAGIVDWRVSELARLGVAMRYDCYAGEAEIARTRPDVVIVATGGLPDRMEGEVEGAHLAETLWEVLETPGPIGGRVLLYDGTGTINGAVGAQTLAGRGASLTYATPDNAAGKEMSYLDRPFAMRGLYAAGVVMCPDRRLTRIAQQGNGLAATLVNEYTGVTEDILCDRVVIERGTIPMDALYVELQPQSANGGEIDLEAFAAGEPQPEPQAAGWRLYRIGDAVSSRDIHAAVLDAMRLCQRL